MTSQYQIALAPELGLTPQAFAAAWNESEAARQAGHIDIGETPGNTFDPATTTLLLTTGLAIASGVLINLISDIIIKASQPKKEPEVRQQTLPDGTKVIIVTIRES